MLHPVCLPGRQNLSENESPFKRKTSSWEAVFLQRSPFEQKNCLLEEKGKNEIDRVSLLEAQIFPLIKINSLTTILTLK